MSQPLDPTMAELQADLTHVLEDTEQAVARIIDAVNMLAASIGADDAASHAQLDAILAACSFQDICGQRIRRIARRLEGQTHADASPLLHGPQSEGVALTQEDIDRMMKE